MSSVKEIFYILILLFGSASYFIGLKEMFAGKYAPSIFSRLVWLLLAITTSASVVVSKSTTASIVLTAIFLLGNAAICVASFWKGSKEFNRLEYICLAILMISGIVWLVFKAPLVSLVVSLLAHFVGALPTYKRVMLKPTSESTGFWSLFFIASALGVAASWGQPAKLMIFPIYFVLFDGSMTFLSMRKSNFK